MTEQSASHDSSPSPMPIEELQKIYEQVITALKAGERPRLELTDEQVLGLNAWCHELIARDGSKTKLKQQNIMQKVLCLIFHLQRTSELVHTGLLTLLEEGKRKLHPQIIVFTLNCADFHFIHHSARTGKMLPKEFTDYLRYYLKHRKPQVVYECLKCLENLGTHGVMFRKEIMEIDYPFWQRLLSLQCRQVLELRDHLLRALQI